MSVCSQFPELSVSACISQKMQEATVNEAERLKEQAARARHYASMAAMEDDRSAWLAVAERWQRLADELKLDREAEE